MAVEVRALILDDLVGQAHGVLPDYVWASPSAPERGAGRARDA